MLRCGGRDGVSSVASGGKKLVRALGEEVLLLPAGGEALAAVVGMALCSKSLL